jgi:hypothetical protein
VAVTGRCAPEPGVRRYRATSVGVAGLVFAADSVNNSVGRGVRSSRGPLSVAVKGLNLDDHASVPPARACGEGLRVYGRTRKGTLLESVPRGVTT